MWVEGFAVLERLRIDLIGRACLTDSYSEVPG